jgi:ABC-type multidrug transport system fused ATPase/permease subunit
VVREKIAWIWSFWRPYSYFLIFLFFFTLLSSAVTIAYPLVFRTVIDKLNLAHESGATSLDLRFIVTILAVIASGRLISRFYPSFRAWMNYRIEVAVREKIFGTILEKDYRFFNRFRTGDIVTRLTDDIAEYPKIAWFSSSGVFRAVESGSQLVFCIVALALLNWRLAALSLAPLPIMMYLFYLMRGRLTTLFDEQQKAISETNEMLEATFSGIRIVKAFASERGQVALLRSILKGRITIQLLLAKLMIFLHTFDTAASRIGQVVVIIVGGVMVSNGYLTIGTLYAFYLYLELLVHPMMDLPNLFVTSRGAFVSIDREEEMRQFPVTVVHSKGGKTFTHISEVAFENVTFSYNGSQPALQNINFRIARGTKVAVVGPVACGKSTLLKVMAGLLIPQGGQYLVNGLPISHWEWSTYRQRIGYVPQDSILFSEPIGHNVEFGRSLSENQVRRALSVARMDRDLENLPDGIHTVLGQRGTLVSGGQRQRIAIARALAHQPQLLLLDDCTSSLDAGTEDELWDSLIEMLPDAIYFIVSHRLATILRADIILVMEKGRLIDQGTHRELSLRSMTYREFLSEEEHRAHFVSEEV